MSGDQVKLGRQAARTLLEALERPAVSALLTWVEVRTRDSDLRPALGASDRRADAKAQRVKSAKAKRAAKAASTSTAWEGCWERCGGVCECGCERPVYRAESPGPDLNSMAQMDHVFGRGKGRQPESVETCWILRTDCHLDKTRNRPDAATWWRKFATHCDRHGLNQLRVKAMARVEFVETRKKLPQLKGPMPT